MSCERIGPSIQRQRRENIEDVGMLANEVKSLPITKSYPTAPTAGIEPKASGLTWSQLYNNTYFRSLRHATCLRLFIYIICI